MRAWGRTKNIDGTRGPWTAVTTDANGSNDLVYVTNLCQVLLLNLGESPFFANYGIPAQQTIQQQIYPDYYMIFTQQQFAPFFASLQITRVATFEPTYNVQVLTHQGTTLSVSVPIAY